MADHPQDIGVNGAGIPVASQPRPDMMYVDVNGYEGPLDLLLDLARKQKVDLANISVLALAEQYLAFIETLRDRKIEIVADYLVMAAWLTYLKSRLMMPDEPHREEPSGEDLAVLLQFRLKRLEAMRGVARALFSRPHLGSEVFASGCCETAVVSQTTEWDVTYYELLRAYAVQRERRVQVEYAPATRTVWALHDAEEILRRLIGTHMNWTALQVHLSDYMDNPDQATTALASGFSASLEMVRQGEIEVRQTEPFGPLMVRRKSRNL